MPLVQSEIIQQQINALNVFVEPLTVNTVEEVTALARRNAGVNGFIQMSSMYTESATFYHEHINHTVENQFCYVLRNLDDKKVLGFVVFAIADSKKNSSIESVICALGVDQPYHGKRGFGTILLHTAIDIMRQKGGNVVRLMSSTSASDEFYKKYGFQINPTADDSSELIFYFTEENFLTFQQTISKALVRKLVFQDSYSKMNQLLGSKPLSLAPCEIKKTVSDKRAPSFPLMLDHLALEVRRNKREEDSYSSCVIC